MFVSELSGYKKHSSLLAAGPTNNAVNSISFLCNGLKSYDWDIMSQGEDKVVASSGHLKLFIAGLKLFFSSFFRGSGGGFNDNM